MLSIGKLSAGQERYYLDQAHGRVDGATSLASGAEDYYVDPREARGRWLGSGAARLGLIGDVGPDELRRLIGGLHPTTGTPLRDPAGALRVAAYDLTFSAPKSVSVLFGLGDEHAREMVRQAHDQAVGEAFGYVERSAAAVRRGRGGATVLPAEGLVAAVFRHQTSRAGDPQLHSHVVIANIGRGPDGRWSALDGRRLYAQARAASFLYQAVLRGELSRSLDVGWGEVRNGIAELDGVPAHVLRAFSRRRAEIEEAMADRGTAGPRAAEAAAVATRRAKDRTIDQARLQEEWRARATELGWRAADLQRVVGRDAVAALDEKAWSLIADDLAGPEGLTRERSTFGRRDVLQAICQRLPAGLAVSAAMVERLADHFLSSPAVVPLVEHGSGTVERPFRRRDGRVVPLAREELRYTTRDLLMLERRLLETVERCHAQGGHDVAAEVVEAAIARRTSLTADQADMVRRIAGGAEGIVVVAGRAGTGKTFALAAAREAWEAADATVLGAAVARRAARELDIGAGIQSTSVHALLRWLDQRGRLPERCVVVIDEAGMLGTRQLSRVVDHVTAAGGKLVLVGDHRQLPELEAGGAFRALARRPQAVHLRQNRRQVEAWERTALDHLREGNAEHALSLYEAHGRLVFADSDEAIRERLVADWWAAGDPASSLMIAHRRFDAADLNRRARERMRAAGQLRGRDLVLPGERFAAGDRIVLRRNELALGVHNGDLARVIAVDADRCRMQIEIGREKRCVDLGQQFLLRRSDHGEMAVAHGYAVTAHVAQGLTVRRAFVLAGPGLSREWAYAAMTRGRDQNHLYASSRADADRAEYAPTEPRDVRRTAREQLAQALTHTDAQQLALEFDRFRGIDRGHGRGIEL